MSKNLDNTFDEILTKDGNVFFVDKLWVKSLSDNNWVETLDLHSHLKNISDKKAENFFRIDIKGLTNEKFIRYFLDESDLHSAVDISDYRVFMDAFSKIKPGIVVFYRTHLISSDMLRLFSKLIKHVQQHNLEWKFVFYGKAKKMPHIAKDRLFIEHYYPEEFKNTPKISKQVIKDSEPSESLIDSPPVKGKSFNFVKGLIGVFVLVIAGTLIYFTGDKLSNPSSNAIDNQLTKNSTKVDTNLNSKNKTSESQDSLEPNQTLNVMIRESKLQALEFENAMAEINAAQALELSVEQEKAKSQSTNSKSNKTVNNQDNKTRLLSSDIEKAIAANDLAFLQSFSDKEMLAYGRDSKGETPLILSVNNGSDQIVQWLLQQNLPVDSRDSYGRTALFYSAIKGNEKFVTQLLQAGAQVSLASNLSKTPLMAAVHNNHYENARLLLATKKAQINAQDHSGWSALFYAIWNSNSKMVNLLLEFGADTNLVDTSGLNIDQVASAAGFTEWQNSF